MSQKIALVTGGAKRIGARICTDLVNEGWHVILHYNRSLEPAQDLANEVGAENFTLLQADFTNHEEVKKFAYAVKNLEVVNSCGGLDLIVHNASIFYTTEATNFDWSESENYFAIHHNSPALINSILFESLKKKSGSVVGIIDTSQGKGWKNLGVYSASKVALKQNLLSAAVEFAPSVRVNCVCPGAIMLADWEEENENDLVEKIPLKRLGNPSDISSAVIFLANSGYITGQSIYVDGGWSIS